MADIIEAQDLPVDEKIYLKKDILGWRVVEPMTRWYHWIFGSKRNFVILIIILFIAGALYLGINEVIGQYKDIAQHPCNYCPNCFERIKY